jgi:hypothetical protein
MTGSPTLDGIRAHFNERWWFVNPSGVSEERLIAYGIEKRILEIARMKFLPGYEERIFEANARIGLACLDIMNPGVKALWYPAHAPIEHAKCGLVRHK